MDVAQWFRDKCHSRFVCPSFCCQRQSDMPHGRCLLTSLKDKPNLKRLIEATTEFKDGLLLETLEVLQVLRLASRCIGIK